MKALKIVLLVIIVFVLIISAIFYKIYSRQFKTIEIGKTKVFVEIADTSQERERGLSGRKHLKENSGMLFLFEVPGHYSFWMKGMLIPLDFIWIKEKRVVDLTQDVQPQDYQLPTTLSSRSEVDMVLEVKAGFIEKNNIEVGDKIRY